MNLYDRTEHELSTVVHQSYHSRVATSMSALVLRLMLMAILGIQTFTDENFLTLNNYGTVSQKVTLRDNEATVGGMCLLLIC